MRASGLNLGGGMGDHEFLSLCTAVLSEIGVALPPVFAGRALDLASGNALWAGLHGFSIRMAPDRRVEHPGFLADLYPCDELLMLCHGICPDRVYPFAAERHAWGEAIRRAGLDAVHAGLLSRMPCGRGWHSDIVVCGWLHGALQSAC